MNAKTFIFTIIVLAFVGCVSNKAFNPAATQPATVVDLSTTQPSAYWDRPAVASVETMNFQKLWDTCAEAGRRYGFSLDRQDFREGLLTSKPLVSKQILEPWKNDTGTAHDVFENSLSTMRRTIHFEIENQHNGMYRVTPKVLVERFTILEHRVTSAVEYRSIFAGPASLRSSTSVTADQPDVIIPIRYFTPIDRDTLLEKHLAKTIYALLEKSGQKAVLKIGR